ncbi:MAG: aminopeptidase P family protein [Calditrichia bacterium]
MFKAGVYQARRKQLKELVGSGVIVINGNNESAMNYKGNPYHFRQDSTFLYYFGIDLPSFVGIIDCDEDKDYLFGYDFGIDDIIWMGDQPSLQEIAARSGIEHYVSIDQLGDWIRKRQSGTIHWLPQYRAENILMLSDVLEKTLSEIREQYSEKLIKAVVTQREIKSDEEVAEIEKALDISFLTHTTAMKIARAGMVEREVVAEMMKIAYAHGARESFPIIYSIHGETLHNHYHGNTLEDGKLIVNDSGVESPLYYASDITRTYPVSGKFTEKQKEIYQIVLNSQLEAIDSIKPGVRYKEVHLIAARVIAAGLVDAGLMKGEPEAIVEAGAHALFFPHGLGHMLGLDVHDMENLGENYVGYDETVQRSSQFGLAYLRLAKELKPGMVLTVEPGIYFIPQLISLWKSEGKFDQFINYSKVEEYLDFGGVRIEDDVLVTVDGNKVLGKPIPKSVEEVEAACRGNI